MEHATRNRSSKGALRPLDNSLPGTIPLIEKFCYPGKIYDAKPVFICSRVNATSPAYDLLKKKWRRKGLHEHDVSTRRSIYTGSEKLRRGSY